MFFAASAFFVFSLTFPERENIIQVVQQKGISGQEKKCRAFKKIAYGIDPSMYYYSSIEFVFMNAPMD